MISHAILKELIFNGVKFSYESYDHKKAVAEMDSIRAMGTGVPSHLKSLFDEIVENCYGIPDEIKQNNVVWRTGKLRLIYFDKNGEMCRFKIGNRYYKNFYMPDFGVKVKPKIFKADDRWNLISQGLAVEETL
jgi:hypothetical protein